MCRLSDLCTYADTYRFVCHIHGEQPSGRLAENFGTLYPETLATYFTDLNAVPGYLRERLGV